MLKLIFYLSAALLSIEPCFACSCGPVPEADQVLARSDAVFTGVVTRVVAGRGDETVTTFRVTEAFKGVKVGTTVAVRHRRGPSPSCGVDFERGVPHTLAAHRDGAGLRTGLCSTWMFLPHIPTSDRLVREMRALRGSDPRRP